MTWETRYRQALSALGATCSSLGCRWMIIGGIAVIARGVVRTTDDVDATIWAPGLDIDAAIAESRDHQIVIRVHDAREMADRAQILLMRHEPTSVDLDVSLAWLPFEEEALTRAQRVDFGEGLTLPVARAEDLVIYKSVAWRDQDRQDVERLLHRHRQTIDRVRVRGLVEEFARLLEIPERLREFDELVSRVDTDYPR